MTKMTGEEYLFFFLFFLLSLFKIITSGWNYCIYS
jgi:hypothetical protein